MPSILWQGVLGVVIAGLVAVFAYAFSTQAFAATAVERIRRRRGLFRLGGLLIVVGVVVATEADAIYYLADLEKTDPRFTVPTIVGYLLITAGVAVLDALLWTPWSRRERGEAPPAPA